MTRILTALLVLALPANAVAGDHDDDAAPCADAARAAGAGAFLPSTRAARLDAADGVVRSAVSVDGALGVARLEASAEVALWGRVALSAGVASPAQCGEPAADCAGWPDADAGLCRRL